MGDFSFADGAQALGTMGVLGLGVHDAVMTNKSTKTANALAEAAQRRTMDQADTAHQREIKDLAAAGLNPVLSGMGGSGLGVGSGASGFQVRQSMASRISSSAQAAAAAASAMKLAADGKIAKAQATVAKDIADAQRNAAVANAQTALNNARVSSVDADFTDSPYGRGVNAVKRTGEAFGAIVDPIRGALFSSAQRTGRVGLPVRSQRVGRSGRPATEDDWMPRSDDPDNEIKEF